MRAASVVGGVLGGGLALLLSGAPLSADVHKDEKLGYSLSVPAGWNAIPISGQEKYIVARWQSDKEYLDGREGVSMRPEIEVVLFDPKGKKTAAVREREGGAGSDITIENPYRTYKDWVKGDSTGGRYISKEEEIEVGGVKVTWYEVAYEKLTVPRHGLAYVFHAEDIDYCFTTEILEQHWQKANPMLFRALKSVKLFPRTGSVKRETTGDSDVTVIKDLSKLTPEERYKHRVEEFERKLRISTERLTEGWKVVRGKHHVALTHADAKFTERVLEQADSVREWLDANLAFLGAGIAGPEMLRICKDSDEERAFSDLSSRSGGGWSREICTSPSEGAWGLGWVAGRLLDRWLNDKNPRLGSALPPWVKRGISDWIGSAYIKGGKLTFRPDGDLIVALKLSAKLKKLIPVKDLIQMSSAQISEWDDKERKEGGSGGGGAMQPGSMLAWRISAWQQTSGFMRYLLEGPGKRDAKTKDLLPTYVANLEAVVKDEEGKPSAGQAREAPKTEQEEEERFKNRETYWKDHEKDLLKAAFERTFKGWTDADWESLEKSYRAYAAK